MRCARLSETGSFSGQLSGQLRIEDRGLVAHGVTIETSNEIGRESRDCESSEQ